MPTTDKQLYLFNKMLSGACSTEEADELVRWLQDHRHDTNLTNLIDEQIRNAERRDVSPIIKERLMNMLPAIINGSRLSDIKHSFAPTYRIHFIKTAWLKYAAVLIIVFGTIAYLWTATKKTKQPLVSINKHLQTDIAPGHDRAILTLASGQQILLDSTQGNIVQQGNLTVINVPGKLSYEGIGAEAEYNTIATPKGGQYQIVLPDGSKVWLNASSSVKFPTAFTGATRRIEIKGEVYLEIAKNSMQSFSVKVNETEIQVLGTSFNVNAYEDEPAMRTTLITGSIKLSDPQLKEVILKPGQQAIINKNPVNPKIREITVQTADAEQTLAWKNAEFMLDRTSLTETMRQLSRWYDIEIVYEKEVPAIELGGKIPRDLTLLQMLDALRELGLKFRIEGRRLIVL